MADQLSGGAKCVKYTLFIFNMLFLLAGLALIIVGAIVQVHTKDSAFSSSASSAGIFIIVVGAIVFLVSFFGCAGAINNNYCMVVTYGLLLIILLLAEIAGVITGFVLKDKLRDTIEGEMFTSQVQYKMHEPGKNDTEPATLAWDKTQQEFECCGTTGPSSWNASTYYWDTRSVPVSCCKKQEDVHCGDGKLLIPDTNIFDKGCLDKLMDHLKYYLIALGAVAAGVALIELIGIVMAFCLASHLKKDYRVV